MNFLLADGRVYEGAWKTANSKGAHKCENEYLIYIKI